MGIDDPRPIIKAKPFANEDANLINCFGMEGVWSEIDRGRRTASRRGAELNGTGSEDTFLKRRAKGRMANDVYLHRAQMSDRKRVPGPFVSGSEGAGTCYPAPAGRHLPSRRGICFHLVVFTLQRPGCLRSADPSPRLLTGADEVLDRWL